ncbi:DUF3054 domain-containing protein [Nocardia donostiensis]|uniref:DUF3054 domain-containing protein n=1 Tax=Nocardia donostiensis TaxID=1538463 RepID=A0A1W0AQN5_9NOCA|nr:DUF3054 domain-containing protein [Nocardia donostiensis]ONM46590.1 hypothetical protein B0T46_21965 [Nocardia donostiensis]OQS12521.1 hypothetical protein B0T36_24580 [Nocardia donostiensis]OQS19030.1 hypothetical protein B0T44_16250 [Nocardia donostiensis]
MKKIAPIAVDLLLVVVFCMIGRRSHEEAVLAGLLYTVWPFAAGLALGWVIAIVLDRRRGGDAPFDGTRLWPTGVVIWVTTVIAGMLLRVVSGQGTAFSFFLVAGAVLAFFLLGWRTAIRALN